MVSTNRVSRFREGDFIESTEGLIFDVKGLIHPPHRVIAFVRYFPSINGDRERDGIHYQKVYDLGERYAFLKKHFPQYLYYDKFFGEMLIEVPIENVSKHEKPVCRLAEMRTQLNPNALEEKALKFTKFLIDTTHISQRKIGVSGSLLVGLASQSSDLDLIIYGVRNGMKLNLALKKQFDEHHLTTYGPEILRERYKERCVETNVPFKVFMFHELRKPFQGFYDGTEFFIRYVKDWTEIHEQYGENTYTPMGRVKICGTIDDDSDSLFTPCFYRLKNVKILDGISPGPISGIISFRGRFCQQALFDEQVVASGKLEQVKSNTGVSTFRLVLGNSNADFMVTIK